MPTHFPLLTLAAALCFGVAATAQENALPAPVLRWDFTALHWSGEDGRFEPVAGKRPAFPNWKPKFAAVAPSALELSGEAGQRLLVAEKLAVADLPQQDLTIEAWVRVDRVQPWGGFLSAIQDNGAYERGWLLGFNESRFLFGVATQKAGSLTYLRARQTYAPGFWYHVVGTYDGTTQRLYVDGELAGSSTAQSGPIAYPPSGVVAAGAYVDDNEQHPIRGGLDRVSLWDRALSAEQVAALFAERKQRFPGIDAAGPEDPLADQWPTYRHDNARSGALPAKLPLPLRVAWVHRARHAPEPAWPPPAKRDYWKGAGHNPRVVYDRAYHVVTVGDRVWYASSADDQVRCLDAAMGRTLWSFFTQGPVRLAPTFVDDKLLFGSDDGRVYCLAAETGKLLWKYDPYEDDTIDSERRIPGNQRIIDLRPVRTGVLVQGDTVFFCRGIFPEQGVEHIALELATGKVKAFAPIQVSAQGYLAQTGGRLHVPTGRNPSGAFLSELKRSGKGEPARVAAIDGEYSLEFIATENARFGGGDGKIAAFSPTDGKLLWSLAVDGRAYSLAATSERLLVSTDTGHIYCLVPGEPDASTEPPVVREPFQPWKSDPAVAARSDEAAQRLLKQAGVKRGYALVIDSHAGDLAVALAQRSDLHVVCLEEDPGRADALRRKLAAAGLYGRIVVHSWDRSVPLPYTDFLFNLVAHGGQIEPAPPSSPEPKLAAEIVRVLHPTRGCAAWGPGSSRSFAGVGEWTHMYADAGNTTSSGDTQVSGDLQLQWFGKPGPRQMIDRHHRTVAPLFVDGRLFVPGENRVIAADGYNGAGLWNLEVPNSARVGALRDCSYLAAAADTVYIAAGSACWAVEAESGERRRTFDLPEDLPPLPTESAKRGQREWGYVACVGDRLFGSAVKPGAIRRTQSRAAIDETYYDRIPVVGSDALFAFHRQTGERLWTYQPQGLIANPTIGVAEGRVLFLESNAPKTLENPSGRARWTEFLSQGATLTALDASTGKLKWRTPVELKGIEHNGYLAAAAGKVVLTGSRNGPNRRVWVDLHAFDAATGKQVWSQSQDNRTAVGGSHGEQDHHPVLILAPADSDRPDLLLQEPHAYELHTGKPYAGWKWNRGHRRGCGTLTASATTLFFRDQTATRFDLTTGQYQKVTGITRPGCWINMIPAGGLLLVPEASSGCSCNFAVQSSLAYLPKRNVSAPTEESP